MIKMTWLSKLKQTTRLQERCSAFELWYNTNNVLDCFYCLNLTAFYKILKYKKACNRIKNEKKKLFYPVGLK